MVDFSISPLSCISFRFLYFEAPWLVHSLYQSLPLDWSIYNQQASCADELKSDTSLFVLFPLVFFLLSFEWLEQLFRIPFWLICDIFSISFHLVSWMVVRCIHVWPSRPSALGSSPLAVFWAALSGIYERGAKDTRKFAVICHALLYIPRSPGGRRLLSPVGLRVLAALGCLHSKGEHLAGWGLLQVGGTSIWSPFLITNSEASG